MFPLPGSFTLRSGTCLPCHICEDESSRAKYSAEEIANFLTETEHLSIVGKRMHIAVQGFDKRAGFLTNLDFLLTDSDLRARKVPSEAIRAIFSSQKGLGIRFLAKASRKMRLITKFT